jgi:hypothetical protein
LKFLGTGAQQKVKEQSRSGQTLKLLKGCDWFKLIVLPFVPAMC